MEHIIVNHPGLSASDLNKQFSVDIQIQEQEERLMQISPGCMDDYRKNHNDFFLSGEKLASVERESQQERDRKKKRPRGTVCDLASKRQRR